MLQTMNASVHRTNEANKEPKLKLFTCRVIYTDVTSKNTWFTILDTSKDAAQETCKRRMSNFKNLKNKRGYVSSIEVKEIEGPFTAGQILHEER